MSNFPLYKNQTNSDQQGTGIIKQDMCFVCLRTVSCVPNVASVSMLSILDCPFGSSTVYLNLHIRIIILFSYSSAFKISLFITSKEPFFTYI